jgi:hypothetical protein
MRRGRRQNRVIFGTSAGETQHADNPVHAVAASAGKTLFDRHGEAGDQPRNLIQMSRIKRLNGFRKTKQAFVITHGGNVAGDDRRSGVDRGGRDGWHRISSMKPGGPESF